MKSLLYASALAGVFLLLASSGVAAQSVKLTKVWESDTTLTTPESVLYDAKANVLYVSCINGGPAPENSKSFIAKVSPEGKIIKRNFTENLTSTKECIILLVSAYLSYLCAEGLYFSGIITLFTCGFTMSHYAYHSLSPDS